MVRIRIVWSSIAKHSGPLRVLRLQQGVNKNGLLGRAQISLEGAGAVPTVPSSPSDHGGGACSAGDLDPRGAHLVVARRCLRAHLCGPGRLPSAGVSFPTARITQITEMSCAEMAG